MKQLEDVYSLSGMLTPAEVDCPFQMGEFDQCAGVSVEIGSWKGKSTVALARGAAKVHHGKIYAIDPHKVLPEEGYFEDTESDFRNNLAKAGVENQVAPLIMTSENAARGGDKPIRMLWIDGDHRYAPTLLDFTLWEPYLAEVGILAISARTDPNGSCGNRSFALAGFRSSSLSTTSPRCAKLNAPHGGQFCKTTSLLRCERFTSLLEKAVCQTQKRSGAAF